jgi:hypothetical protein
MKLFGRALAVFCFLLGAINLIAASNIFGQAHSAAELVRWGMIGLMNIGMGAFVWWLAKR